MDIPHSPGGENIFLACLSPGAIDGRSGGHRHYNHKDAVAHEAPPPLTPLETVTKFFSLDSISLDNVERVLNCVPLTVDPRSPNSRLAGAASSFQFDGHSSINDPVHAIRNNGAASSFPFGGYTQVNDPVGTGRNVNYDETLQDQVQVLPKQESEDISFSDSREDLMDNYANDMEQLLNCVALTVDPRSPNSRLAGAASSFQFGGHSPENDSVHANHNVKHDEDLQEQGQVLTKQVFEDVSLSDSRSGFTDNDAISMHENEGTSLVVPPTAWNVNAVDKTVTPKASNHYHHQPARTCPPPPPPPPPQQRRSNEDASTIVPASVVIAPIHESTYIGVTTDGTGHGGSAACSPIDSPVVRAGLRAFLSNEAGNESGISFSVSIDSTVISADGEDNDMNQIQESGTGGDGSGMSFSVSIDSTIVNADEDHDHMNNIQESDTGADITTDHEGMEETVGETDLETMLSEAKEFIAYYENSHETKTEPYESLAHMVRDNGIYSHARCDGAEEEDQVLMMRSPKAVSRESHSHQIESVWRWGDGEQEVEDEKNIQRCGPQSTPQSLDESTWMDGDREVSRTLKRNDPPPPLELDRSNYEEKVEAAVSFRVADRDDPVLFARRAKSHDMVPISASSHGRHNGKYSMKEQDGDGHELDGFGVQQETNEQNEEGGAHVQQNTHESLFISWEDHSVEADERENCILEDIGDNHGSDPITDEAPELLADVFGRKGNEGLVMVGYDDDLSHQDPPDVDDVGIKHQETKHTCASDEDANEQFDEESQENRRGARGHGNLHTTQLSPLVMAAYMKKRQSSQQKVQENGKTSKAPSLPRQTPLSYSVRDKVAATKCCIISQAKRIVHDANETIRSSATSTTRTDENHQEQHQQHQRQMPPGLSASDSIVERCETHTGFNSLMRFSHTNLNVTEDTTDKRELVEDDDENSSDGGRLDMGLAGGLQKFDEMNDLANPNFADEKDADMFYTELADNGLFLDTSYGYEGSVEEEGSNVVDHASPLDSSVNGNEIRHSQSDDVSNVSKLSIPASKSSTLDLNAVEYVSPTARLTSPPLSGASMSGKGPSFGFNSPTASNCNRLTFDFESYQSTSANRVATAELAEDEYANSPANVNRMALTTESCTLHCGEATAGDGSDDYKVLSSIQHEQQGGDKHLGELASNIKEILPTDMDESIRGRKKTPPNVNQTHDSNTISHVLTPRACDRNHQMKRQHNDRSGKTHTTPPSSLSYNEMPMSSSGDEENAAPLPSPSPRSRTTHRMKKRIEYMKRMHKQNAQPPQLDMHNRHHGSPQSSCFSPGYQNAITQRNSQKSKMETDDRSASCASSSLSTRYHGEMSPKSQQGKPEPGVQIRINAMRTQHQQNMNEMRHALEEMKEDGSRCGEENKDDEFDGSSASVSSPSTVPAKNEQRIADCVGRWKSNAKRFEKARERYSSLRKSATTPKHQQSPRVGHLYFD